MHCRTFVVLQLAILLAIAGVTVLAQQASAQSAEGSVVTIRPNYLPPSEIIDFLGAKETGRRTTLEWKDSDGWHTVDLLHNDAANLLIVSGVTSDVTQIEKLVREADVAPRQIEIEVKIVEVSTTMARDLGIDWEQVMSEGLPRATWLYSEMKSDDFLESRQWQESDGRYLSSQRGNAGELTSIDRRLQVQSALDLSRVVKFLDENGAATIRNAPRILTLNNRWANILDGQRVTYITRYSSYTNLFETDSMDAGLALKVLPSLGESGYITLRINAELTALTSSISGSPVKDGQMIENTVIVKDGESVLLGGLSRSVDQTVTRRFPLLGHVLPFLFSRETKVHDRYESLIILTPRVVDFATALDVETMSRIEGD